MDAVARDIEATPAARRVRARPALELWNTVSLRIGATLSRPSLPPPVRLRGSETSYRPRHSQFFQVLRAIPSFFRILMIVVFEIPSFLIASEYRILFSAPRSLRVH